MLEANRHWVGIPRASGNPARPCKERVPTDRAYALAADFAHRFERSSGLRVLGEFTKLGEEVGDVSECGERVGSGLKAEGGAVEESGGREGAGAHEGGVSYDLEARRKPC